MITEESINQTKFYRDEAMQHYLVTEVRSVKLVTLINCRDGAESKLLLGDDVCLQFVPVDVSFKPVEQVGRATKKIKKTAGKTSSQSLSGKRRGKPNPFSKFKGVTKARPKKDGTGKYLASFWDGTKQKNICLGTFDNELLAAAAVAEHKGDKDEAKRLRVLAKQKKTDMKEQAENNPDRPPHKKRKEKIWVCKTTSCGIEYRTDPTINGCLNCKRNNFRVVPGGGD